MNQWTNILQKHVQIASPFIDIAGVKNHKLLEKVQCGGWSKSFLANIQLIILIIFKDKKS